MFQFARLLLGAYKQPGAIKSHRMRTTRMGTTYIPSLWKWYHRHGYWARRKKKISFDAKSQGYHEWIGPGKTTDAYQVSRIMSGKMPRYISHYFKF